MVTTSTHDTKRSADVRARLAVLSEIPDRWRHAVHRWRAHAARHKIEGRPEANTEYLLYQTLVGAWPIDRPRLTAYMRKAVREAKRHTSWTNPDDAYEAALDHFVGALLDDATFCEDLETFVAPLVAPGRITAMALTLLSLTVPGVPDLYQGNELWDLSLVDPDNRRPVDFARRRHLLAKAADASADAALEDLDSGFTKLWMIHRTLRARAARPAAFGAQGRYEPLIPSGSRAAHAVAYLRGDTVLAVVPRLVWSLGGDWGDTRLTVPPGRWRNVLADADVAGGDHGLGELLARFPMALLVREP